MKYMLLIYLDEKAITDAQRDQCYEDSAAFASFTKPGISLTLLRSTLLLPPPAFVFRTVSAS